MHGMLTNALRAAATLRLKQISMEQAERLLASTWCILEAHALASPNIEIRSSADLVDISLTFGSAEDCSIVRACWQRAWCRQRQVQRSSSRDRVTSLAPKLLMRVPVSAARDRAEPSSPEGEPASQPPEGGARAILPTPREKSRPLPMPRADGAARGCRFIIGDPKDFHLLGEAIYCAAPVERIGESWCAAHRRLCYAVSRAGSVTTMIV